MNYWIFSAKEMKKLLRMQEEHMRDVAYCLAVVADVMADNEQRKHLEKIRARTIRK